MDKKLNINYLINNVIFTIDEYYKNDIIPKTLKGYLYLITTGMILNYGDEYIKDIYRTIFETNFVEYSNSLEEHLYYVSPISNNYIEKEIVFKKIGGETTYNVLYREIDESPIKTLEYLTYQINYILFNKHKKKRLGDKIRMRFSTLNARIILREESNTDIMESIINVIQTEAIIKEVLKLNFCVINNYEFKSLIVKFKDIDVFNYQMEGIDILANLFKPLYKDDKLKRLIDSYDNVELLKKEFDSVLGRNAYKKTYGQLVKINDLIKDNMIENFYKLSCYYVDVRNNIINRYISLKEA